MMHTLYIRFDFARELFRIRNGFINTLLQLAFQMVGHNFCFLRKNICSEQCFVQTVDKRFCVYVFLGRLSYKVYEGGEANESDKKKGFYFHGQYFTAMLANMRP